MIEQMYRKKLKWRIWISSILLLIGLLFTCLMIGMNAHVQWSNYRYHIFFRLLTGQVFLSEFQIVCYYIILLGVTIFSMIRIIKSSILLKNEDKFKKEYIKETDEQNLEIIRQAKSISWNVTLIGILLSSFYIPSERYRWSGHFDALIPVICILITMISTFLISYWLLKKKHSK